MVAVPGDPHASGRGRSQRSAGREPGHFLWDDGDYGYAGFCGSGKRCSRPAIGRRCISRSRRRKTISANVDFSFPTVGSTISTCPICRRSTTPLDWILYGSAEETNDPLIADHRNFLQGREVDVSVKLPQGSQMATLTLGIEATLRNVG